MPVMPALPLPQETAMEMASVITWISALALMIPWMLTMTDSLTIAISALDLMMELIQMLTAPRMVVIFAQVSTTMWILMEMEFLTVVMIAIII